MGFSFSTDRDPVIFLHTPGASEGQGTGGRGRQAGEGRCCSGPRGRTRLPILGTSHHPEAETQTCTCCVCVWGGWVGTPSSPPPGASPSPLSRPGTARAQRSSVQSMLITHLSKRVSKPILTAVLPENEGTERLSNLPKATQLVQGRLGQQAASPDPEATRVTAELSWSCLHRELSPFPWVVVTQCHGCCHTVPQTERLKQQRFTVCLAFLAAGSPRSRWWQSGILPRWRENLASLLGLGRPSLCSGGDLMLRVPVSKFPLLLETRGTAAGATVGLPLNLSPGCGAECLRTRCGSEALRRFWEGGAAQPRQS